MARSFLGSRAQTGIVCMGDSEHGCLETCRGEKPHVVSSAKCPEVTLGCPEGSCLPVNVRATLSISQHCRGSLETSLHSTMGWVGLTMSLGMHGLHLGGKQRPSCSSPWCLYHSCGPEVQVFHGVSQEGFSTARSGADTGILPLLL